MDADKKDIWDIPSFLKKIILVEKTGPLTLRATYEDFSYKEFVFIVNEDRWVEKKRLPPKPELNKPMHTEEVAVLQIWNDEAWVIVGVFSSREKAEIGASLRGYTKWSISEWGIQ